MRITYNNGELNLSMTHDEAEHIYKNKGRSISMDISWLKVLHEDISKCVLAHWSRVEVWDALESHQKTVNSKSKSKK
jgi:hypothetical protein|tara:strand:+ start:13909 stop:14139 length:231 start_codon:yes stop_codon:yes gene_type:complete